MVSFVYLILNVLLGTFRLDYKYKIEYESNFPIFKPATFPEPLLVMFMVICREGSSCDELAMRCDSVKPKNLKLEKSFWHWFSYLHTNLKSPIAMCLRNYVQLVSQKSTLVLLVFL